jgi:hypothetical protein
MGQSVRAEARNAVQWIINTDRRCNRDEYLVTNYIEMGIFREKYEIFYLLAKSRIFFSKFIIY